MSLPEITHELACGNCGHGSFGISGNCETLYAKCRQCGSVTEVRSRKPELVTDWGEHAQGILCPMTPKTK